MRKIALMMAPAALLLMAQVGCSKKDNNPTTPPPACSVEILTPQGGEAYVSGERITVRYNKAGSAKTVRLDLIKGNNLVGEITDSWQSGLSPATYPWTATTMGAGSGEDYRIAVVDFSDSACSDTSQAFGLVSGCNFQFPYTVKDSIPRQTAGDVFTIEWTGYETSGFVDLELWESDYNGPISRVGIIAVNQPDNGSHDWTVDSFNFGSGDFFRFVVRDHNDPPCQALSITFSIDDPDICSIAVSGIFPGQSYPLDSEVTLTMSQVLGTGIVDIRMFTGNKELPGGLIAENYDLNDGPLVWTVTDFGYGGAKNEYNVRVIDDQDPYCVGKTANFTIPAP